MRFQNNFFILNNFNLKKISKKFKIKKTRSDAYLISCTKSNVFSFILVVTIILFTFLNLLIDNLDNLNNKKIVKITDNISVAKEFKDNQTEEIINEDTCWSIEIPSINLTAKIAEGTTEEIMNEYVGHFENTELWNGNVGLAAHNRRISCKLFWKA